MTLTTSKEKKRTSDSAEAQYKCPGVFPASLGLSDMPDGPVVPKSTIVPKFGYYSV